MVDMNEFARLCMGFAGKDLPIKHIPGPMGVRGRNSDNTLIKQKLHWAPSVSIKTGVFKTYLWIKEQVGEAGSGTLNITLLYCTV